MNSKRHLLNQVQQDRREGYSLSSLAHKYKLAKSTVSMWCRDVKLSAESRDQIKKKWLKNTEVARAKGTLRNKLKRVESINREQSLAKEVLGILTHRDLLVLGIGLYWAEGSKKENGSGFSFINSDSLMIVIMYKWLVEIMHVKADQLLINLCINISHKDRESEILKFWSNLLDLPVESFGNTIFIKTRYKRMYANSESYFGMLRMRVRSSSWLRRRILGMIKIFTDKYADVAQVVRASHS